MNNIENINMLYKYALDNSEYILLKEMFYSALFFNTASAMALKNIRIVRKTNNKDKVIIPNYFAITFAGSGCVDEETEFLTPKGWKKISEYEVGDLVCQWNEDGSTQFINPIAYISEPEYEKCIKIKSNKVDRFICNNHRMPVVNIFGNVSEIKSNKFVSFDKNILQRIKHIGFNEKTKKNI